MPAPALLSRWPVIEFIYFLTLDLFFTFTLILLGLSADLCVCGVDNGVGRAKDDALTLAVDTLESEIKAKMKVLSKTWCYTCCCASTHLCLAYNFAALQSYACGPRGLARGQMPTSS